MDVTESSPQGGETPQPGFEAPNPPAADDGRPLMRCIFRLTENELRGVLEAAENPGEPPEAMVKGFQEYREAVASGRLVINNRRPDDAELPD